MGSEPEWKPPYELWKVEEQLDMGAPVRKWVVARFSARDKAMQYLHRRGFSTLCGNPNGPATYHRTERSPAGMTTGMTIDTVSYELREVVVDVPLDPE